VIPTRGSEWYEGLQRGAAIPAVLIIDQNRIPEFHDLDAGWIIVGPYEFAGAAGTDQRCRRWVGGQPAPGGLHCRFEIERSLVDLGKVPDRQPDVARSVCAQRLGGNSRLRALMIESHLVAGRQDIAPNLAYGQSITDACIGFEATRALLMELAEILA